MKLIWSDNAKSSEHKEFIYTETTRNVYDDKMTDALLGKMQTNMETLVGKNLLPTYSFFRFYPKGSGLKPHRDIPSVNIAPVSAYTGITRIYRKQILILNGPCSVIAYR